MGTLSGQTIQSTYEGLLKLSNSQNPVTNILQSVEDGFGNETGMKISSNYFTQKNQIPVGNFVGKYYGVGITTSSAGVNTGNDNRINIQAFYDQGRYYYSAITWYVQTASATDTFEAAIYTSEFSQEIGFYPSNLLISGITANTTTTGLKTYVFPQNIILSAENINFLVFKFTTTAATRTLNFRSPLLTQANAALPIMYGHYISPAGNYTVPTFKSPVANHYSASYSGLTNFQNTFVESDFNTLQTNNQNSYGFVLHTVR